MWIKTVYGDIVYDDLLRTSISRSPKKYDTWQHDEKPTLYIKISGFEPYMRYNKIYNIIQIITETGRSTISVSINSLNFSTIHIYKKIFSQ